MAVEHNRYISGLVVTHSKNRLDKSLKDVKMRDRKLTNIINLADDDELLYTSSARGIGPLKLRYSESEDEQQDNTLFEQPFKSSR